LAIVSAAKAKLVKPLGMFKVLKDVAKSARDELKKGSSSQAQSAIVAAKHAWVVSKQSSGEGISLDEIVTCKIILATYRNKIKCGDREKLRAQEEVIAEWVKVALLAKLGDARRTVQSAVEQAVHKILHFTSDETNVLDEVHAMLKKGMPVEDFTPFSEDTEPEVKEWFRFWGTMNHMIDDLIACSRIFCCKESPNGSILWEGEPPNKVQEAVIIQAADKLIYPETRVVAEGWGDLLHKLGALLKMYRKTDVILFVTENLTLFQMFAKYWLQKPLVVLDFNAEEQVKEIIDSPAVSDPLLSSSKKHFATLKQHNPWDLAITIDMGDGVVAITCPAVLVTLVPHLGNATKKMCQATSSAPVWKALDLDKLSELKTTMIEYYQTLDFLRLSTDMLVQLHADVVGESVYDILIVVEAKEGDLKSLVQDAFQKRLTTLANQATALMQNEKTVSETFYKNIVTDKKASPEEKMQKLTELPANEHHAKFFEYHKVVCQFVKCAKVGVSIMRAKEASDETFLGKDYDALLVKREEIRTVLAGLMMIQAYQKNTVDLVDDFYGGMAKWSSVGVSRHLQEFLIGNCSLPVSDATLKQLSNSIKKASDAS
jgi:hypothetical protein